MSHLFTFITRCGFKKKQKTFPRHYLCIRRGIFPDNKKSYRMARIKPKSKERTSQVIKSWSTVLFKWQVNKGRTNKLERSTNVHVSIILIKKVNKYGFSISNSNIPTVLSLRRFTLQWRNAVAPRWTLMLVIFMGLSKKGNGSEVVVVSSSESTS